MTAPPQLTLPVPLRLAHFARDYRGFIVPFFVAWFFDGQQCKRGIGSPDFRVVDPAAFYHCVRHHCCWLCGQPLGARVAFVLGPMCVITRVNSEPGSHRDCAQYAMRVCPFLTKPNMRRNPSPFETEILPAPGEHSDRNPGVMALWITSGAELFNAEQGEPGVLFTVNDPSEVVWWREGRHATREEVELGLAMALPALEAKAARQGRAALEQLYSLSKRATDYLPREPTAA